MTVDWAFAQHRWLDCIGDIVHLDSFARAISEAWGKQMRFGTARSRIFAAATTLALALAPDAPCIAGPFSPLAGNWIGSGILTAGGGARERIRCRAIYFVSPGGANLRQILRCASDSFTIDVNADVTEIDGRLSGTWRELTSGVTGTLTGFVRGADIRGVISGLGINAPLSLITRGRFQYASISLDNSAIASVVVTFHRL